MTFTNQTSTGSFAKDLFERVVMTFLQAFLGALITGGVFDVAGVRNVSAYEAAVLAGVAAVLALGKGLAAKWLSNRQSASLAPGV